MAVIFLLLPFASVQAEICEPTPGMHMGTHHKPITTAKVDISKGMVVSGQVLSSKDCKPIAGARIAHWQTNTEGVYVDELRAFMFSDNKGNYRFETEWPGAPIPHIHFQVSANGYKPLTTQWIGDEKADAIKLNLVLEEE